MAKHVAVSENIQADLAKLQSDYRTINAMLQGAKRRGSKADVRELTRSKNRISERLDQLKSQATNQYKH